jgi:uncharacterized phage protein (predicted DNA packaging)
VISELRQALRITSTHYDTEIAELVEEAKQDLILSGVDEDVIDETDPLIRRVIRIYVKANFGWDNPDSEKLQRSYELLKSHLALSVDYVAGDE